MNITEEEAKYDKNLDLIREYRAGSADAGCRLYEVNKPLILSIATRFCGRGVEFDDLLESGTVGFVKAINTFDPERGCAFSTYAVPLIFGEIRRFIRDDGMIKVSREQKRLSAILNAERERRISAGEDSGIAAVANACGVDVADASVAIFAHAPPRSLDEAAGEDGDGASIGDLIADPDAEAREFDRLALRLAIEKLEDSERRLIILRYFRDYSQVETARALGISQVKVSRMEKRILDRLRSELL